MSNFWTDINNCSVGLPYPPGPNRLGGVGKNTYGQLGRGYFESVSYEYETLDISGASAIASASFSSFAIIDGELFVTGYNAYGMFGIGSATINQNISSWTATGITGVTALANGYIAKSMAIIANGELLVSGSNYRGQLGLGASDFGNHSTFIHTGIMDAVEVSVGSNTIMYRTEIGDIFGAGENDTGELGVNSWLHKASFVKANGTGYTKLECGYNFAVASGADGLIYFTGDGGYGQQGRNNTTDVRVFTAAYNIGNVIDFSAGAFSVSVLTDIGGGIAKLWSVGKNDALGFSAGGTKVLLYQEVAITFSTAARVFLGSSALYVIDNGILYGASTYYNTFGLMFNGTSAKVPAISALPILGVQAISIADGSAITIME